MPDPSKIHPNLAEQLRVRTTAALQDTTLPIIVLFRPGSLSIADSVDGVGPTKHVFRLIPATSNVATKSAIEALTERDDIVMIWHDAPVHTLLDVSVPLIGAPEIWTHEIRGQGIKVGIVDTGIDPLHPDFAGRIAQVKDLTGEGPTDNNGHGTHVAGIVGGSGEASGGKYRGVAPECTFYAAKVLGGDGSGSTSSVMAGIEWAVQQSVQVINMSLGGDGACDGTDALSVTCDAAVARGIVMCVAAGNSGPGPGTVGSPGCARSVITIGATDKEDQVASFSSRGPTVDGRTKPDVCFPGVNITSCRGTGTSMGRPVDGNYTTASGTSMATPHATGACALLLQAKPDLTPQEIKDLFMSTAKGLGLDANAQGKGRADVWAAYASVAGHAPEPEPTPEPVPQAKGCWALIKSLLGGR